eukprot:CAMPEP_0113428726 /NCGR_PEP_ID=MMETSP0013_2-20120614/32031_1 /TAXON_ID=2843 ORGANISM="Skeletonema costatum, Strain 1716" /NCGR_SAMPLE_ID=MMETSP0013_2 /ASSEMBLY_ACC=CAM_ASM_000158 /LENGTH=264 /DNA_ID=CAMNT_0000317323 /DNA_START=138 /DNA_END=928 /DNA_ORIENTATION=+ /assembly_acc=CAM_ASM_000158
MANSKFLKLAVAGAAVAAIAIGIGVGAGIRSKNKRIAEASAANSIECRRLLLVPGIDIEDNVADAPSIRRKLLARRLGEIAEVAETSAMVDTYKIADDWEGDTWSAYPVASITKSSSKGLKGTQAQGPTAAYGFASGKGPKGPKGSKGTYGITDYYPKKSKGKGTYGITSGKGYKGSKGSKSKGLPSYCYAPKQDKCKSGEYPINGSNKSQKGSKSGSYFVGSKSSSKGPKGLKSAYGATATSTKGNKGPKSAYSYTGGKSPKG